MKELWRHGAQKALDYFIPLICAGALVAAGRLPKLLGDWGPVVISGVMWLAAMLQAGGLRREVTALKALHRDSEQTGQLMMEAARAQLDDAMGKLYAGAVHRGYTTEDERRCYERMEKAYEGIGGNGEAKRRAVRFFALPPEEEWLQGCAAPATPARIVPAVGGGRG